MPEFDDNVTVKEAAYHLMQTQSIEVEGKPYCYGWIKTVKGIVADGENEKEVKDKLWALFQFKKQMDKR